ncbi:uncharacterized protein myripa [Xenentodon cancila]
MGRKLDLTGLTDNEASHVLQVVQRDMRLRKREEERLSELKQELDEEGSRCLLLSRQTCFNQRCCIRCCSPFTFLLNPKHRCNDCSYNVCKACRVYNKREKVWLCTACQKSRLLRTQSLEWFYVNVKKRFKRFGSAKVLKTLYRKHLAEHSALSELTEGSACEESICNEDSICGSDSAFYRQTEEHSMAETLSVAMRVAEEAIDEAISTAEDDTSTQQKQNEAHYLREHKGELIEELAKTIVQKIISRRKTLAEMRAEYEHDWPLERNADLHHQPAGDQASSSLTHQSNLWDSDPPALIQDCPAALKKEGAGLAVTAWKSVDRLDNSVLKSPDGNWIALQSAQLSRPSLLTKRKSLVYSALEKESGVVSAYEVLGSENQTKPEPDGSWGAVLQEIHRRMMDSNSNLQDLSDRISPLMGHQGCRDNPFSDSEGNWKPNKHLLALLKRKVPAEIRKPSSSRRTSIIDVNFNLEGAGGLRGEGIKEADEADMGKIRKSRRKKKINAISEDFTVKLQQTGGGVSGSCNREEEPAEKDDCSDGQGEGGRQGSNCKNEEERAFEMEIDEDEEKKDEDKEIKHTLYRLVAESSLTYFSSTEDELDREGQSEGEWDIDKDEDIKDEGEEWEEKTEQLTYRLCQLENQARATQYSSTEDELDRIGTEEKEEEDAGNEGLSVKVCRLVNQISATQFSSTEDELDKVGRGEDEEEVTDEAELWKLQTERTPLCDLVSLVSAAQFSSTEDELDRVGEDEGEIEQEVSEGGMRSSSVTEDLWERAGSMGELDMKMFDLKVEVEERKNKRSDGKVTSENLLASHTENEDDIEKKRGLMTKEITGDATVQKEQLCDERFESLKAEKDKEMEERREMQLKTKQADEIRVTGPERNRPDEKEEKGRTLKESKENKSRWEMIADSDEDDPEFDRIISSMLTMTLEDIQVEAMKDQDGISFEKEAEKIRSRGEGGFGVFGLDAQSEDVSEKSGKVLNEKSEPSQKIKSDIRAKEESGDTRSEDENMQEERQISAEETLETDELKPSCPRTAVDDAEKRCGKGNAMEEWEEVWAEGDTADYEETDVDEEFDETEDLKEEEMEQSSSSPLQEGFLSADELQHRYSAVSLRSITTEVLKVLNATEELLQGVDGGDEAPLSTISLPSNTDPEKLDQQFSRLEEKVYVAAGSVYSLEAELSDLEECAREICSSTSHMELSFLEEQVAAAAAKVQQSELQVSDISTRIAALKSAGLDVDPQSRFTKTRTTDMSVTLDASRQMRRRLPAPPTKEDQET